MERRLLPALPDHRGRRGAYAQPWDGWVNPLERAVYPTRKVYRSRFDRVYEVENRVGCYAFLYDPQSGSGRLCVAYIGKSKYLQEEIRNRYRGWKIEGESSYYPFAAIYIPSHAVAGEYESDLLRYYAPPWNTYFR